MMISVLVAATSWAQTSVVTFNLNMENETVSAAGVYIAGSFQGWEPGATEHELTDPDGDGVYSIDVVMENVCFFIPSRADRTTSFSLH